MADLISKVFPHVVNPAINAVIGAVQQRRGKAGTFYKLHGGKVTIHEDGSMTHETEHGKAHHPVHMTHAVTWLLGNHHVGHGIIESTFKAQGKGFWDKVKHGFKYLAEKVGPIAKEVAKRAAKHIPDLLTAYATGGLGGLADQAASDLGSEALGAIRDYTRSKAEHVEEESNPDLSQFPPPPAYPISSLPRPILSLPSPILSIPKPIIPAPATAPGGVVNSTGQYIAKRGYGMGDHEKAGVDRKDSEDYVSYGGSANAWTQYEKEHKGDFKNPARGEGHTWEHKEVRAYKGGRATNEWDVFEHAEKGEFKDAKAGEGHEWEEKEKKEYEGGRARGYVRKTTRPLTDWNKFLRDNLADTRNEIMKQYPQYSTKDATGDAMRILGETWQKMKKGGKKGKGAEWTSQANDLVNYDE